MSVLKPKQRFFDDPLNRNNSYLEKRYFLFVIEQHMYYYKSFQVNLCLQGIQHCKSCILCLPSMDSHPEPMNKGDMCILAQIVQLESQVGPGVLPVRPLKVPERFAPVCVRAGIKALFLIGRFYNKLFTPNRWLIHRISFFTDKRY